MIVTVDKPLKTTKPSSERIPAFIRGLGALDVGHIDRGSGIRIRIFNSKTGRKELGFRIPMGLIKIILSLVPVRYFQNLPQPIGKNEIYQLLRHAVMAGLLVDVFEDDQIVQVRIGRITKEHYTQSHMEGNKMSEQQVQILKMLEEGKITTEEADKLLTELRLADDTMAISRKTGTNAKMIRIRVYEGNSDRPKVRVSVPLSLAKFALRFVPKDAQAQINDLNMDLDEIVRQIEEGAEGRIVDVEDIDEETGKVTKVEIWVE